MRRTVANLVLVLAGLAAAAAFERGQRLSQDPGGVADARAVMGLFPERLSETGVFTDTRHLIPAARAEPYSVNVEFWSDGAAKDRWLLLPEGASIRRSTAGEWDIPPGTVAVKHFEMPLPSGGRERIETRLLRVDPGGWVTGATYRWRRDGSDADLVPAPRQLTLLDARPWYLPGPGDCGACHTRAAGGLLGINRRQLDRPRGSDPAGGQGLLQRWMERGLIEPAAMADNVEPFPSVDDEEAPLDRRARAYLHVNCAQCHNPGAGAISRLDLRFDTPLSATGLLSVGPPDTAVSALISRLETLDARRMPPLAHERIDQRGLELIRAWIAPLAPQP